MSDQHFDIDVDPLLRTDLVFDLPGDDWDPDVVVPALTALSDRMLSQPHLDGVFRLVVLRDGTHVFDSDQQPLVIGSSPESMLRGTIPRSGQTGPTASSVGMTLMVAPDGAADRERIRRSRWPVLLWIVGGRANDLYIQVHRECKPMRTVSDPAGESDRLALVCGRFLDEVAMSDRPDVTKWIDNRVSPITEGMGYIAG